MPVNYVPPPPAVPAELRTQETRETTRAAPQIAETNQQQESAAPARAPSIPDDGFDRNAQRNVHVLGAPAAPPSVPTASPGSGPRLPPQLQFRLGNQAPPVRSAIEPANVQQGGSVNRQMLDWYAQRENYDQIHARLNDGTPQCANFASHALEMSGALKIPHDAHRVGFDDVGAKSVRRWSPSLAAYLEKEKGWQRVTDTKDLQPGDIIFTQDKEGTYNHTTVFQSWFDQEQGFANVIDNQGFTHPRSLPGEGLTSPFMYAVRSPN